MSPVELWALDEQTLRRFLICVQGDNDQWYWTQVLRTEKGIQDITFYGREILFTFSQTLYGSELYDHEGHQVGEYSRLELLRHVVSGDIINPSYKVRVVFPS